MRLSFLFWLTGVIEFLYSDEILVPCPFPFLFPLDLPGTVAVTLELFELLLDTVPLALEGVPVVVALEGVPAVALEGVPVVALEGVPAVVALEGVPVVVALEGVPVVALEGVPVVALEGVPLLLFRLGL